MPKCAFRFLLVGIGVVWALATPLQAQELLYAATGSRGVNGVLYTVDPTTAVFTQVGPILAGASPLGITGLAFDPLNGLLYGVTGLESPNSPRTLVTINPATGAASVIGSLIDPFGSVGLGDISFRSDGTLFGYSGSTLYTVNLSTGGLTAVGSSGNGGEGDALAFSPTGTLYSSNSGPSGTLDTLDPSNGALTTGPTLTNAPQSFRINAFAIDAAGVLFGSNNSQTTPDRTVSLISINTTTGSITNIGLLPNNSDAIAFTVVPEPSTWTMLAIGALFMGIRFRARLS